MTALSFDDPALVSKFGSWARVQVAFYDFIFQQGTELCAAHWKELALKERMSQFSDGGDLYERSVNGIMQLYPTASMVWEAFLEANKS